MCDNDDHAADGIEALRTRISFTTPCDRSATIMSVVVNKQFLYCNRGRVHGS